MNEQNLTDAMFIAQQQHDTTMGIAAIIAMLIIFIVPIMAMS